MLLNDLEEFVSEVRHVRRNDLCNEIAGAGRMASAPAVPMPGSLNVTGGRSRRGEQAQAGAPWRDLPHCFGNWFSVWKRFRRWALKGVFERV
jgi:hypothetical protein